MTKIEFLMSVDGSTPQPVDVQHVADFAKVILSMRNTVYINPPAPLEPKQAETSVAQKPRYFPPTPPVGERSIDYAIKAALTYDGTSFTLADLLLRMEERGWKTRSVKQRERVNTVRATVREHPDFINQGEGHWTYEPKQSNSPTSDSYESDEGLFPQA